MPRLDNPRHERFAQARAKGEAVGVAYITAGYKQHDSNPTRLDSYPEVVARIAEIQGRGAARAEITIQRVLEELAKVGFANMADYMRAGADGDPYLDFSALSRDQAAALAEVTVEDFRDGRGEDARDVRRVKFKLADKLGALEKIGNHLGMFKKKLEVTGADGGPIETKDVSARDILADRLARLAAGTRSDQPDSEPDGSAG
ncbi:terminase small subunit [Kaistia algarum]|uniref:terminase small subunit n=1 Tax=Kaistia algarum TaxID=2083279 RepID=UPI000CE7E680|nr:terminase small subunit [Kaistia algarum]MCX5516219.1 terminase small subunit [Kaistia algarum]PPE78292.1 terminase small subunit [Kaistia algarum]